MEWLQAFMIAGSTIGGCYWMHRESRSDMREHKAEMKAISEKIQSETKDFHGRLCTLEERYLQMMQKYLDSKGK